ncbi:MAG: fused MFS/spermidine synthase [Candidatus Latescibacterota bacterium]|nr:fused MFS/spermidine synthase [Candidatus Latescibacterota bacterium]
MHNAKRLAVFGLFFFSGSCALVYQITWMRLFRLVMGNTVFTSATVLTAFMAGLAIGSFVAGRLTDRSAHPLRAYAWLEVLIGLCGFAMIPAFNALAPVYGGLYAWLGDSPLLLSMGRFLVSAALLALPATLMGATLPLLSRFMTQRLERMGRDLGRLYALNTLGAALGAALTGFLLVPSLGVQTTLWTAALANLSIGATAFALARTSVASPVAAPQTSDRGEVAALWALGLTGFASMVYEVSWTRTLSMLLGSSVYAFSLMLVAFICGLGLGSMILAGWIDRRKNLLLTLAILELAIGATALLVEPLFGLLPLVVVKLVNRYADTFALLHLAEFAIALGLMLLPTFAAGGVFPAAAKLYTRHLANVGRSVGDAYAANTLGAVLGSFAGGFLLIPLIGVQTSIILATSLNLGLGLYFLWRGNLLARPLPRILAAGILLLPLAVSFLPAWDVVLLNSAPYLYAGQYENAANLADQDLAEAIRHDRRLLYAEEGMSATVTVWDLHGERFMRVNGKVIASSQGKDLRSHSLLAHLPLLLHEDPRDVLLIGLGCGISLGAIERHPVTSIDCVELSPEVVEATALFSHANQDALADPRLNMLVGDGRNHVALSRRNYDVIISQPSNLWIAGMADLFTSEFFQSCRQNLKPGGLAATWIQAYALQQLDVQTIIATFKGVFPHVAMWELMPGVDYLLVGSEDPIPIDPAQIEARLATHGLRQALSQNGAGDEFDLLSSYVMGNQGLDDLAGEAPTNTDDNARLEFSAPRGLYLDLSRTQGLFSLEDLADRRRTELDFVEGPVQPALVKAWRARHLALDGLIHERRGEYARALINFAAAARWRPQDIEVRRVYPELSFKLAENALRRRRFTQAQTLYDSLLAALPEHAAGHYRKGELHELLQQWEDAAHSYRRAGTIAPTFAPAHMRLGAIHTRRRNFDQAIETYRRGLEAMPKHLDLLNNLGTLYLMQDRFEDGLAVFHQALAIDSTDARVWNNLGTAFLQRRQYVEAQHWLEGAIRQRPTDATLHLKLADAYRGTGAIAQAREVLKQALKLSPDDERARRMSRQLGD